MDAEWIARCRQGDARAWEAVVRAYERLVYSIPLNLGLSAEDADDVTQATFGVLLSSLDSLTEPDRLGAWLSTVARRQSIRVIEAHQRERRRAGAAAAEAQTNVDDSAAHQIVDDVEWVHQGLSRLSDRCQRVLAELFFSEPAGTAGVDGGTVYEAAAARLGMPVGSIGPTRKRCLESLREALATIEREVDEGRRPTG